MNKSRFDLLTQFMDKFYKYDDKGIFSIKLAHIYRLELQVTGDILTLLYVVNMFIEDQLSTRCMK